jgi:hypothetical protein
MLLRNRLRILLLYGVNGHRLRSQGGKAGILADGTPKANVCQRNLLSKALHLCGFYCWAIKMVF